MVEESISRADQLRQQITERATPRKSKPQRIEQQIPTIATQKLRSVFGRFNKDVPDAVEKAVAGATQHAAHKAIELLKLDEPQVGFDQDIIASGYLPMKPVDRLATNLILAFARPRIVEIRNDRDIVQDAKDWVEQGNNLVVVSNHLSHADGPEVTEVLEDQGIHDVTSILGLRIIRNPFANRVKQGVPIITVYPESEQFWKEDAFKDIEPTLTPQEREYVQREKGLAFRMTKAALRAINKEYASNHPILVFPEGSRSNADKGLQDPVQTSAGIINRGTNVKILVMTVMGTENLLQKGKGPRFAKVQTRFVELLDASRIKSEYKDAVPDADEGDLNNHMLDQIMRAIASGLEPKYRGKFSDSVLQEVEFRVLREDLAVSKQHVRQLLQRLKNKIPDPDLLEHPHWTNSPGKSDEDR
jgi:1-acyl-sn-glycerol-3-phosphate acyltransferase